MFRWRCRQVKLQSVFLSEVLRAVVTAKGGNARRSGAMISIRWFFVCALAVFVLSVLAAWFWYIKMPGTSYSGESGIADAAVENRLRRDVSALSETIGERHVGRPGSLDEAARWISQRFVDAGLSPGFEEFATGSATVANVVADVPGTEGDGVVVIGAHYDSVPGSPGADDNASGVAVMLELARSLKGFKSPYTLRFVAFVNEEAPWFGTSEMGSIQHVARALDRNEKIVAMLSLETLGFYQDEDATQHYPDGFEVFYPSTGNFVSFVGNARSRTLVHQMIEGFRQRARLPSEGIAAPELVRDISRSDQFSFWREGIPAMMITDTANFRNPHYHLSTDTAATLNYSAMAHLADGLTHAIKFMIESRFSGD